MVVATAGFFCWRPSPALQTFESMAAGRLAPIQRGGAVVTAAISAGLLKPLSSFWLANSTSSGTRLTEKQGFSPRWPLCNVGHVVARRSYYREEGDGGRPSNSQVVEVYEQYRGPQQPESAEFPRPTAIKWDKDWANSVNLIGRVGRDMDIKYLDSGKVVATTSFAVSKPNQRDEEPSWFFLEMWDGLAEIANHHVTKGEQIFVTGKIVIDKRVKDEVTYTNVKILVMDFCFVEPLVDRRQPYGQSQAEVTSADSSQRNWNQQQFSSQISQGVPVQRGSSSSHSDEALATEKRWQEYFADPTQWWDNRGRKRNPKAPDFKHKSTQEALWIDSWRNPPWVPQQLAVLEEKAGQHNGDFGNSSRSQETKLSSFKDSDFLY